LRLLPSSRALARRASSSWEGMLRSVYCTQEG
jgi:hypothetical protein